MLDFKWSSIFKQMLKNIQYDRLKLLFYVKSFIRFEKSRCIRMGIIRCLSIL